MLASLASARTEDRASVSYHDGRFTLHTETLVRVPPEQVRAILTRYENLARVNSGIQSVQILARPAPGQVRMRVDSHACILVFCRAYRWEQEVREWPFGDVTAIIDPAVSDFREGRVRWQFLPVDDGTQLVFDATLAPDFWFPPLIGPWLIKHKLLNEALETARGVERLARRR